MTEAGKEPSISSIQPTKDSLEKEALLKRIYAWASQNTSETRQLTDFKYYWPSEAKKLLTTLELSQGSIIALVGLSGVGKSSALCQIAKTLNEKKTESENESGRKKNAVYFKWPGYFDTNVDHILEFLKQQGVGDQSKELIQQIIERAVKKRDPKVLKSHVRELLPGKWDEFKDLQHTEMKDYLEKELGKHNADPDAEGDTAAADGNKDADAEADTLAQKLLGPTEAKIWKKELTISLLSSCHSILLDLRDYGMKDIRAMNTDLNEIQNLWQAINEHITRTKEDERTTTTATVQPNIVFVLQKELAFSSDTRVAHYFLGKARIFEITPFLSDDLIKAYEMEFGSIYPFGQLEDLRLVARLSRGIFRKFLKYIQLCIELHIQKAGSKAYEEPLSSETADVLARDEISKDWEVELRQLFPRGSYYKDAFVILKALVKGPRLQHELCKYVQESSPVGRGLRVNIDEMELSRMLSKLEEYGYVRRDRLGNRKIVYLNM